jgi:hypothetical protein
MHSVRWHLLEVTELVQQELWASSGNALGKLFMLNLKGPSVRKSSCNHGCAVIIRENSMPDCQLLAQQFLQHRRLDRAK